MFDCTDIGTDPVTMKRCKICKSAYSRIEISSVSHIFKWHKHIKAHTPLLSVKYRSLCKCYPKFVSRKVSVSTSRMSIPTFTTVSAQSRGFCKAPLEFCWMFRSRFIKDLFSKGSEIPKFERFHLISLFNLDWDIIFKQTSWKCPIYVPSSPESVPAFGWMFVYSFVAVTLWLSRC